VKVMVVVGDGTLAAAANVMICGVPGVRLSVAGEAVTPVGSPDSETETIPLNAFREFTSTKICAPAAPIMIVAEVGVTLSEKSGAGEVGATLFSTPPHEMIARQQSWHARKAPNRPRRGSCR
jgi:hypothetical protein